MANLYYFLDKRQPRKDGTCALKIGLSHNRKTFYSSLDIFIRPEEWDAEKAQIIGRADKKFLNIEVRKKFADAVMCMHRIEKRRDFEELTARDILDMIARGVSVVDEPEDLDYLVPVYNEYITLCRKSSTAAVYRSSLRNLEEYCDDLDSLRFKDINVIWLRRYQHWLTDIRGMEVNGANVYLRNLRTVFNFALQNEFTRARYPFRDIDMSTTDPDKRTIPYEKFLDWATKPMPDYRGFYRDLFMLSFYLCGIRPVDLLSVKKNQVEDGRLVYCPQKLNGRTKLSIKIEPEAWELIKKYEGKEHLLSIMDERTDYRAFCKHWNAALKAIGEDVISQRVGRKGREYSVVKHIGIVPWISVYYARSCWATYAYNVIDVPMDTISQALGHKSGLRVTNFYVKRDAQRVDQANRTLIDRVKKDMEEFIKKAGA